MCISDVVFTLSFFGTILVAIITASIYTYFSMKDYKKNREEFKK